MARGAPWKLVDEVSRDGSTSGTRGRRVPVRPEGGLIRIVEITSLVERCGLVSKTLRSDVGPTAPEHLFNEFGGDRSAGSMS
jgi:hypothetical protein